MITQSSKLCLERAGIISTYRRPCSTLSFNKDRTKQLTPPDPFPLEPYSDNGDPSPDRINTAQPWPHGYINETENPE